VKYLLCQYNLQPLDPGIVYTLAAYLINFMNEIPNIFQESQSQLPRIDNILLWQLFYKNIWPVEVKFLSIRQNLAPEETEVNISVRFSYYLLSLAHSDAIQNATR